MSTAGVTSGRRRSSSTHFAIHAERTGPLHMMPNRIGRSEVVTRPHLARGRPCDEEHSALRDRMQASGTGPSCHSASPAYLRGAHSYGELVPESILRASK